VAESGRILKVGIAGLGVGSTQIIPAMAQMPGMQLVAAADFRKDALETFKQKYAGRVYDSVEKLCADPEVEALPRREMGHGDAGSLFGDHAVGARAAGNSAYASEPDFGLSAVSGPGLQ